MSNGKYRKDHNCLNCGSHVEEHYCSSCGQPNLELKENFWQFISHSIAHYFHFDNKFFQTLVPLLTKPGKVTLDYLAGKRARYINPVSMYIFVSIVYFLVVSTPNKKHKAEKERAVVAQNIHKADALDSLEQPLDELNLGKSKLVSKAKKSIKQSMVKETFSRYTFKQQDTVLRELKAQNLVKKSDSLTEIIEELDLIHISRQDSTYLSYLARQKKLPMMEQDNFFERLVKKRSIEMGQNSEIIQEQLEHNRPKQYFLLMPLMALFISINFRKNHIYYLDHLIFTIHGMTAFFLVQIITKPLNKYVFGNASILASVVSFVVVAWLLWYMFKSLKIFYNRSNSTTVWRMIAIFALYSVAFKITEVIILNIIYYIAV
ncbi:DUF3667 domain-containing protein [Pedobacter sp. Hv1]|uniref:DUF3667 domain-containing protein n=1 Tax=Pedobacter sp. Hv1 TaxID=1740090 RepID=UPI0006D8D713|nr:DUF3667 domain-containing protein [Pedobacter sp. Hv1]KQC00766.1 hypothetical protein AQF98_08790 [Pedobacter sp. Hv1]